MAATLRGLTKIANHILFSEIFFIINFSMSNCQHMNLQKSMNKHQSFSKISIIEGHLFNSKPLSPN